MTNAHRCDLTQPVWHFIAKKKENVTRILVVFFLKVERFSEQSNGATELAYS